MSASTLIALEALGDLAKLALAVAGLYVALGAYVRHRQPSWADPLARRRAGILLLLVLAASAIKLGEDVLGGESGPIDRAILLFIHDHVPRSFYGSFAAITFTGSSNVLVPLTVTTALALLFAQRRVEALLISLSVLSGALLVLVVKIVVGRARPALWDTEWYWGSSFPSGHSLVVASFATAFALCVGRIMPSASVVSIGVALGWTSLVAMSRLVIGVHWPTDVLVAACLGAAIPIGMSVAVDVYGASRPDLRSTRR